MNSNSNCPEWSEVRDRITSAAQKFENHDSYLLRHDLNERTISHKFALYLEHEFPGWDIDCEYNRSTGKPKSLRLPKDGVNWDDTHAKTVFPDVIVHRRGTSSNLLVIEIKKVGLPDDFDRKKLKAYKLDHQYRYAVLLRVRVGTQFGFESPEEIGEIDVERQHAADRKPRRC